MFNPRARWDRNLPTDKSNCLNEKIEVVALFKQGKIIPRYFNWKNTGYRIKKINYSWQEKRGNELINYFSVDTNGDFYQISFNNKTFAWIMHKAID